MKKRYLLLTGALLIQAGCGFHPWKKVETRHLVIHYKPGTYAEQNLQEAKKVYEHSFISAEQFLPRINKTAKLNIFLHENLKAKGYSNVDKREVHYRYSEEFRLTSKHEMLHVFLYELNPNAPLRLEEGVCRLSERKRKKFKGQFYDIRYYQLVKFVSEERWKLAEVFVNQYKDDDEGNIAAAFTAYSMNKMGPEKFWAFYQKLDKENWREHLRLAFGLPLEQIDREFKLYVQKIPDPPEAFKVKFSPKTAHLHQ